MQCKREVSESSHFCKLAIYWWEVIIQILRPINFVQKFKVSIVGAIMLPCNADTLGRPLISLSLYQG